MTVARRSSGLAFLLGLGCSLLPAFAPFVGLLFVLTTRLRFRRADLPWIGAAALSAIAVGAHTAASGALFGFFQVVGPWAVLRAFGELHNLGAARLPRRNVLQGLSVGFLMLVLVGFGNVRLNLAYPTITQAISWGANPALFAHTVLAVGALVALLAEQGWLRVGTLLVAAIGILATGSREAGFGLTAVVLYLCLTSAAKRQAWQFVGMATTAAILIAALWFGPAVRIGRIGYLVASSTVVDGTNLVQGSELPHGGWWDKREVRVRTGTVELGGRTMTVYDVTKQGTAGWLRLQQLIPIESGHTYTLSAWVLRQGAQHPGIQGWGRANGNTVFALTTQLVGGRLQASLQGPGSLERYGVAATDGPWTRIFATFLYSGGARQIDWYVGLAPDNRPVRDTTASFAGFQLEPGPLTPYVPGAATKGLGFGAGRLTMWRVALNGIARKPLLGWGSHAFPSFYQHSRLARAAADSEAPAHAHNLFLEVLFERGIVGFVGLLLLLTGMAWAAVARRDPGFLVVLGAVLLANVFDYTFFFGGVIYPLAAVAGWRSGEQRDARAAADSLSRQFAVRLLLAAVDLGLAWAAFALSRWGLPLLGIDVGSGAAHGLSLARYALFLWPAMAWREGLYPGYGLTEPDQLKRQVWGAFYAGIIFLAGTVFFEGDLGVTPAVVVAATVLSVVLLPVGRGVAKRILRALGLWGRPVVIIGGGDVADDIARTLHYRSLDGLRPVAMFGDRERVEASRRDGADDVPYVGPVSAANAFARREGIHHAIVVVDPAGEPVRLPKLDPAEDAFTVVQYVPDLPGLPVLGVRASSLDNLLALEVRNELASPANRAVKRVLDLAATVLGGLLISPLLLALGIAVVADSRGPAFFAHTRIGRNGRKIRVWKFRTMVKDAPEALERHLSADPVLRAEWEATHKLKDDPRVTRIGRFLRRFSLDELPQLWNVLKGEMSLVGPRPIVDAEVPKYADAFALYTMVRPGMTGYWQISGRSDTDYGQRVELDSFYVRNWSVWLDVVVLIKTVSVVLRRDGAY